MHEDKDKSVDHNANIDQSIGSGDKVVEEIEEVASDQTVLIGGCQKPCPDDHQAVEDAEEGVHQHQHVQGALVSLLHGDADQVAICQIDQQWGGPG